MNIRYLEYHIWSRSSSPKRIDSSLIICTYQRPETIIKLFNRLINIPDLPDEIVVVDGSQNKDTFNALSTFFTANTLSSTVLYLFAQTGLTIQRNAGIDISKGEIIHFLDDDCLPEPYYFSEIEKVFRENPDVGGVTGAILNEMTALISRKNKIREFLRLYPRNGVPGKIYCNGSSVPKAKLGTSFTENYELDAVSGASMSFRRKIVEVAGGFSEFFQGYSQGEDLEFSLRVRKISKIIMCRSAECNHYHEQVSRPNDYKKGFMEIFNRHYIWRLHVKERSFKCLCQYYGDIIFINIYSLFRCFKYGFNKTSIRYYRGIICGTFKSIFSANPGEFQRETFFKTDQV